MQLLIYKTLDKLSSFYKLLELTYTSLIYYFLDGALQFLVKFYTISKFLLWKLRSNICLESKFTIN